MDEKEHSKILHRIDERTESIQKDIRRIEDRQRTQEQKIDELESKTQKNTSDIKVGKTVIGVVGSAIAAIAAEVAGLISL